MNAPGCRQRRRFLKTGLAICGLAAVGGIGARTRGASGMAEYRFAGDAMGTFYHVTFVAPATDVSLRTAARNAVDAAVVAVDARMSTFAYDSEISQLNRHAGASALTLSGDTIGVLQLARRTSEATAGAFDVTAGPLVNAWGFGPAGEPRIPPARELAALREQVGFALLEIDAKARRVRKHHRGMYVDLSGIAKGYGVDRAAQALDALGIAHYVVELGGEVRSRGRNVDGDAWRVAIEQPQVTPGSVRRVVALRDRAMATSGDYRIYFERAGRRYCHEIDPVSASPVDHALTSVSVVATDCGSADAWATGLMVLGPDAGFALAERLGVAACFVERAPHGALVDRATPAFVALDDR